MFGGGGGGLLKFSKLKKNFLRGKRLVMLLLQIMKFSLKNINIQFGSRYDPTVQDIDMVEPYVHLFSNFIVYGPIIMLQLVIWPFTTFISFHS